MNCLLITNPLFIELIRFDLRVQKLRVDLDGISFYFPGCSALQHEKVRFMSCSNLLYVGPARSNGANIWAPIKTTSRGRFRRSV